MPAKVEMYSAQYCPFCSRARNYLKEKGVEFDLIDVMAEPARRVEMRERADGRHTVPQIFINGKGIGGCDELLALGASGELDKLLAEEQE